MLFIDYVYAIREIKNKYMCENLNILKQNHHSMLHIEFIGSCYHINIVK